MYIFLDINDVTEFTTIIDPKKKHICCHNRINVATTGSQYF